MRVLQKKTTLTTIKAFKDLFADCITTVGVVTFNPQQGCPLGLLTNSFTSLSLNPMAISFNISLESYACEHFKLVDHFILNILSTNQVGVAKQFLRPRNTRWNKISYEFSRRGLPLLHDTLSCLEASVRGRILYGDHYIIIGEVESFAYRSLKKPLSYYKRRFQRFP